jgi:hypothetical protein
MDATHIEVPVLGSKWMIGFTGLFHTAVASLAIGFAFFVTVAQIVGYVRKDRRYDLMAKRVQLVHVCVYNIGTIVAIGLVFALSGLYPQFWSQIFVHLFWTLIVEEFLFFLLATTLTFHYFFWDHLWGHKRLHIFLGALLNPLFFLQFFLINGIGSFMLTPGFEEGQASMSGGILGWDRLAFYNPSFLMLTAHRMLANVSYGGFVVAAFAAIRLYLTKRERLVDFYEESGRLAYCVGFVAFMSLPIIGYFYAHVLKYHANEAYVNLMWGRGDVVAGGLDWWWLKHVFVAAMLGMSLMYFTKQEGRARADSAGGGASVSFAFPRVMIWAVAIFYALYYFAMGMIMTWTFFWAMLAVAVLAALLGRHLLSYHKGSPRAVFLSVGVFSFMTVMLGGYSREASRPRFVDRIAHYDEVYVPEERQRYLMVEVDPSEIPPPPPEPEPAPEAVRLIRTKCVGCHTLERVKNYPLENWRLIVEHMRAYGAKLTNEEARRIAEHLRSKEPY